MAFRQAVGALGGDIVQYVGPWVQVAVPFMGSTAQGLRLLDAIAKAQALARDDDGHYFPLGSDQPPEILRHPIPWKYGPARSFWYYVNYRPQVAE